MSKLVKIKQFIQEQDYLEPLSDSADVRAVCLRRSKLKTFLQASTSSMYNYNEQVYVAELYSEELDKLLNMIVVETSDFATYTIAVDTDDQIRLSYIVTITSESRKTVKTIRLVITEIQTASTKTFVHDIIDNNFAEVQVEYFAEIRTNYNQSWYIGTIVMQDFATVQDTYYNLTFKLSKNIDAYELIAFKGEDPDELQMYHYSLSEFTNDEIDSGLFDIRYVYVKLSVNNETLYYKLVRNDISVQSNKLTFAKTKLSNKYCHIFNNRTAVLVENITARQLYDLQDFTNDAELRKFLSKIDIDFVDVDSYTEILIDESNTVKLYDNQAYIAENLADNLVFSESDVKDLGAAIAELMYDSLSNATDSKTIFKHTLVWLRYIMTRDSNVIVNANLTESQLAETISIAKLNYLEEFSHAAVLFNNLNKRLLEQIKRRLIYARTQISFGMLYYEADLAQIDVMILAISNLINITDYNKISAFDVYTEKAIDTFAIHLEYLKLQKNTIQLIKL